MKKMAAPIPSHISPSGLVRKATARPAKGSTATTSVFTDAAGTVKGSGSSKASPLMVSMSSSMETMRCVTRGG